MFEEPQDLLAQPDTGRVRLPSPLMRLSGHRVGRVFPFGCSALCMPLWGLLAALIAGSSVAAAPRPVLMIGDSHATFNVSGPTAAPFSDLLRDMLGDEFLLLNTSRGGTASVTWNPMTPCSRTFLAPDCPSSGSWYAQEAQPFASFDWIDPMIAVVMLGTNDSLGFMLSQPTNTASYLLNIATLTQALLGDGVAQVMLLTPPPLPSLGPRFDPGQARLLGYRNLLLDYCRSTLGVRCGPDVFTLIDRQGDFSGTSIHLNAAGHAKLADALHQSILSVPEPPIVSLLGVGLFCLAILGGVPFTGRVPTRARIQAGRNRTLCSDGARTGRPPTT